MRQDLIGYLLSALEPHEMREVERALSSNPALREELEYVRSAMQVIDDKLASSPLIEAPTDLVRRTMDLIPHGMPPSDSAAPMSLANMPSVAMTPVPFSNWLTRGLARAHRSDWVVAVFSAAALFAMLLPVLSRVRNQARITLCQDQLRQLGTAISQYVLRDSHSELPSLTESGPEAFAGMYAVRLADQGLLVDPSLRWCPELELPQPLELSNVGRELAAHDGAALVRSEDLRAANGSGDVDALRALQHNAGGHYAYTLGVVEDQHYHAPKYEGRTTFAVLGDSPVSGIEAGQDLTVHNMRWGHGSKVANLLFEDGTVRLMDMSNMFELLDQPFFNHRGAVEAGLNIDDASLAPSWHAPFLDARQR